MTDKVPTLLEERENPVPPPRRSLQPPNRWLKFMLVPYIGMIAIFFVFSYIETRRQLPPVIFPILGILMMVLVLIGGTLICHYSWKLNAQDYLDWHLDQVGNLLGLMAKKTSPGYFLWSNRIASIVMLVLGMGILIYSLYELLSILFR